MARSLFSSIEPLESRIAPASLATINPLPDIVAGLGKTGSIIDLGNLYADANPSAYHTIVQFNTNFDTDTVTPGLQAGIIQIELFDDVAPLTVQNFLSYVNNLSAKGDYDGVFFHRSVNETSPQNLQVLQAGGFDVSNPAAHVVTAPVIPNEYNPAYPNSTGTLSLAKTGAGPNTGSSEFFFNMGDNSQTLGPNNNGGFTVFGKVTQGFDVLQKIFAAPLVDESVASKNGALVTVPYQGTYDPNPDHNSTTPSPALKAANYITFTSVNVVARDAVGARRYTYSVSAFDHGTTTPASFVSSAKVTGDNLTLTYNPAKSGVADVTVQAMNSAGVVMGTDTFSVTFEPNLIVTAAGESFQPVVGVGDAALGQVAVTNNGAAALSGLYNVKYFLSKVSDSDASGATADGITLDSSDTLFGTFQQTINLASGKSAVLTNSLTLPTTLTDSQASYRIIATATPVDDSTVHEIYTNDQSFATGSTHTLSNTFGILVANNSLVRSHPSITYVDTAGQTVVATLTGPGSGQITPVFDSNHQLIGTDLDLFDTTAASVFTVKSVTAADSTGGTAHTDFGAVRINVNNLGNAVPVGTLNLALADLSGGLFALGGVKTLTIGDIGTGANDDLDAGHPIVLGTSATLAKVLPAIKFANVENTVLSSTQVINSLAVSSWVNDSVSDASTVPGLKTFTDAGTLQANLDVNAMYGDPAFLKTDPSTTIASTTFKVGGAVQNSNLKFAGNVGTVDLGAIYGSQLLVGADSVVTDVSQFNSIRTIASFIVRGMTGNDISMSDSHIVAANMTSIKITGALDVLAGENPWGFVADKIASYTRAAITTEHSADGEAWAAASLKNLTTKTLTNGTADVKDQYGLVLL